MATKHNSFDSSHGFFVESPHGFRNNPGTKVLFTTSVSAQLPADEAGLAYFKAIFDPTGAEFEARLSTEAYSIAGYSFIWLRLNAASLSNPNDQLPAWLSQLSSWRGRLLMSSDWFVGSLQSGSNVIAAVAPLSGLTLGAINSGNTSNIAAVPTHPLNAGVATYLLRGWRQVVGGTGLTANSAVAERTANGVSFIVNTSDEGLFPEFFGFPNVKASVDRFLRNCVTVAV